MDRLRRILQSRPEVGPLQTSHDHRSGTGPSHLAVPPHPGSAGVNTTLEVHRRVFERRVPVRQGRGSVLTARDGWPILLVDQAVSSTRPCRRPPRLQLTSGIRCPWHGAGAGLPNVARPCCTPRSRCRADPCRRRRVLRRMGPHGRARAGDAREGRAGVDRRRPQQRHRTDPHSSPRRLVPRADSLREPGAGVNAL